MSFISSHNSNMGRQQLNGLIWGSFFLGRRKKDLKNIVINLSNQMQAYNFSEFYKLHSREGYKLACACHTASKLALIGGWAATYNSMVLRKDNLCVFIQINVVFTHKKSNKTHQNLLSRMTHLKAPANTRAVYSPKLRPHVTSTESIICWPPSRTRNSSTAARLVT